jgi:16S rRNA (uracil1498-N3)-methyltransferase
MQRYFIEQRIDRETVTIKGDDARHIGRVMRMQPGDSMICCDPDSRCAICTIQELSAEWVTASVGKFLNERAELPVNVTVSQGLPKGDKLDLIVQKGTELGASMFLPFEAERSIVKWDRKKRQKKTDRLQKIAKEAAEQAHRSRVPDVSEPISFQELLFRSKRHHAKIAAYEEAAKHGENENLVNALRKATIGDSLLVAIGPEGGFSDNEARALKENGFSLCGLGPRILRTETAALYILAAVSYQFELLG